MESIYIALIGGAVTLTRVVVSISRSRTVMKEYVNHLTERSDMSHILVYGKARERSGNRAARGPFWV